MKSADELTSDRDLGNTDLSAVMEYFTKFNDMCVANAMPCEEKSQRRVNATAGLKEALPILSESALLQRPRPCIELPSNSVKP